MKKLLDICRPALAAGIGRVTVGAILGALAVKFIAESVILFAECASGSSHTLSECMIIGILY